VILSSTYKQEFMNPMFLIMSTIVIIINKTDLPFNAHANANTCKCKIYAIFLVKRVVHFLKKTFVDNLLTPKSSKMSTSFFLQSK